MEFVSPDFGSPLDVAGAIARTPASVTTKGMFLSKLLSLGKRAAPMREEEELCAGVLSRRWVPFLGYPLRDLMRMMGNILPIRFPDVPLREAMRRYGWLAYPTFTESMAGKIVLDAIDEGLESLLRVGPKSIMMSVSHCSVTSYPVAERHWRVEYKHVYCFLDSYHVGIVEGLIRAFRETPQVKVCLSSPIDGVFEVRW